MAVASPLLQHPGGCTVKSVLCSQGACLFPEFVMTLALLPSCLQSLSGVSIATIQPERESVRTTDPLSVHLLSIPCNQAIPLVL